jgi:hypothetical protein
LRYAPLDAASALRGDVPEIRKMVSATPLQALHRNSFHFKLLSQVKKGTTVNCGEQSEQRKREGFPSALATLYSPHFADDVPRPYTG